MAAAPCLHFWGSSWFSRVIYAVSCRSAFLFVEMYSTQAVQFNAAEPGNARICCICQVGPRSNFCSQNSANTSSSPSGHLRLALKSSQFLSCSKFVKCKETKASLICTVPRKKISNISKTCLQSTTVDSFPPSNNWGSIFFKRYSGGGGVPALIKEFNWL